jgi:hypothetical protein
MIGVVSGQMRKKIYTWTLFLKLLSLMFSRTFNQVNKVSFYLFEILNKLLQLMKVAKL